MREPFCHARFWLNICFVLQVLLGILILVLSGIYEHFLRKFLTAGSCQLLLGMLLSTHILGFQMCITHTCSLLLWRRLWHKKYAKNVKTVITIWMFFCFMILLTGFCTLWSLYNSIEPLISATEISLWTGIHKYFSSAEWKVLWDSMQFEMQCCGVDGYEDWMQASWMPTDCHARSGKHILAPYACCKSTCGDCFEARTVTCRKYMPYLHIQQINTVGCLTRFSGIVRQAVLLLVALMLFALKLNFIVCLLTKYIINRQRICIEISFQEQDQQQVNKKLLKINETRSRKKTHKCYCDSCTVERRMQDTKLHMIRTFDDLQECDCEACRDIRNFSP